MTDRALLRDRTAVPNLFFTPRLRLARGQRAPEWLSRDVVVGSLRAADLVIILAGGMLAYLLRFNTLEPDALALYGQAFAVTLAASLFQVFGLYRFDQLMSTSSQARQLFVAWSTVTLCLIMLGFVTKTASETSRLWVGMWFICGYLMLLLYRSVFKRWVRRLQQSGSLTQNVVVIGTGKHAQRFAERVRLNETTSGIRIIGVFHTREGRVPANLDGLPVLGTVNGLERCVRTYPIDQVIIPLPFDPDTGLMDWMSKLRKLPVDVRVCPDMGDLHPEPACSKLSYLSGMPLLNVLERPLTGWSWVIKNLEDRLLAALILPVAAPLMGVIALAIKLDSPGPILFKQKRYGFNNEVIEVFKFRSMYCDHSQDSSQIEQAKRDDPRVTRVGRFIRRTSLDELPQLLNVLKGDMSIVGPRPHAVAHNEHYARLIEEYVGRHRVKPGITGWAQVSGLRGETETLEKMKRRLEYDLNYIENWSVLFDLRIILKTLVVGFVSRNAY